MTVAWDPNPEPGVAGYVVRLGTRTGVYTEIVDAGNRTSIELTGLTPGATYFAAVRAYTASGVQSDDSDVVQFLVPHVPPAPTERRDMNQDGFADVIWHHAGNGSVAVWLMRGNGISEVRLTTPGQVTDTRWKIHGVGDFNGDRKADLLWRHTTEGWLAVWLMDGTTLIDSFFLTPNRMPDPAWRVAAVTDLNGDGCDDLVWQESTKGWIGVWLMNGARLQRSFALSPERIPDTDWRIVGAADMNGDGHGDLLWQHVKDGWLAAWLMNGTTLITSTLLTPGRVADTNWRIVGIADANGDGHPDLYWHHKKDGWVSLWLMTGISVSGSIALQPDRVNDLRWQIVGVR